MSTEDTICTLITIIFDEGVNKYQQNFEKLITRLNEYYDTNKVDIINYLTKAILYLPNKSTIYSNAIYVYNKPDITNEIFKKIILELKKTKNSFVYIRIFIFLFGLIHFNVIPHDNLLNFIQESIKQNNKTVLEILLYSIHLIYRKDNNYNFLEQSINLIYNSNIISYDNIILKSLHDYNFINDGSNFNGFFIADSTMSKNADTNTNTILENIFFELTKINYNNIIVPELVTRKYNNMASFNDIYYQLLLMNNIEAFKDEADMGMNIYMFRLPELFHDIDTKEKNNNINPFKFIVDNFTYASLDLILSKNLTKGDLSYIIHFILCVLKEKKSHFKIISNDDKESNLYTSFITSTLSNVNFIMDLSPIQINNLISFLIKFVSNIPHAKEEIFSIVEKIISTNNSVLYFKNSFFEKMTSYFQKQNIEGGENSEKNFGPNKIDQIINLPYYKGFCHDINKKKPFKDFDKSMFENDKQNEVLYTFIYCIINSRDYSFKCINSLIEFYGESIREIIKNNNDNNDKEKIILKVIFDVYGHLPLYFIYIIDILAYKNILNHLTVVNFIFTEKLFQKKEYGLIYYFYELINNSVENCYYMLNKYDNDFQNLVAKGVKNVDENKRKEVQNEMEFYQNEVEMLKKQKDVICDEALGQFMKLYEMAESLGGVEYKFFVKKIILDELLFFENNFTVNEEISINIKNLFK